MWPLWKVLDTTPEGRGDGYPPLGSWHHQRDRASNRRG